ncbi:type I-E CRISPR-associated protein Cse2/CasB [Succinivibrio sp.]|uniref:type I-E CRISPR-associated protein Cse2/CasB n=1 Tax=Succinivibrio sp. TaxID=2053619 RepID=UPI0025E9B719|nr:type I-E CRISPR-associated protein Cse2/CasB [Succinivibrio sp.]MBQ9219621.1 type I-E CRISPR-associated protein Cse2/CasB [Succinivibrio sp.]
MEQNDFKCRFVHYICQLCSEDKGNAANLRKADLTTLNAYVLSSLVKSGIDITKEYEFLPYSIVTAAIARSKDYKNGEVSFSKALASAEKYNDEKQRINDKRLRRLLACNDIKELALVLRPTLILIQSRLKENIDFEELLKDLCSFRFEDGRDRVKKKWAMQFYSTKPDEIKEAD